MAALSRKRSFASLTPTAFLPAGKRMKVEEEKKHERLVKAVKKLKKAHGAELHQLNNTTALTFSSGGTIVYLATIAIGDDNADRTGASIDPISLVYRHVLRIATTGVARMILFQDSQTYGVVPLVLDVLQTSTVDSQYNVPNQLAKRFRILKDWLHAGVTGQSTALRAYRGAIKKMNKINYAGAAATQASAGRGALYLLRVTDLAATQPTDNFTYSLQFNA